VLSDVKGSLIDRAAVKDLFSGIDADTLRHVLDAAAADLEESCEHLIMSWRKDDRAMREQALHSLDTLCGNFGATVLRERCSRDLTDNGAIAELRAECDATLRAVLAAVDELDLGPIPET
jgi:hypothetical protein